MERRVKEAWNWFDQNTPLITVVVFRLDPSGRVSDVEVDRSSGNSQFDDSVIRAVYKAKLPPPPESVYEKYFKFVRMTFNPREM
jgi:colicin import membrane protein